ncbi:MAG: dicarboxylate/amino acid:cation symporter [Simkaniaceae bacterium]|nr:dicarboxylate/amino acid:cation symporter [Simkaniaceae bacterium]
MRRHVNLWTVLGLVAGIVAGFSDLLFIRRLASVLSEVFIRLLTLISLPMIFLAIVSTITRMEGPSEARTLVGKIFTYTGLTTVVAAGIGLTLFLLVAPNRVFVSSGDLSPVSSTGPDGYLGFVTKVIPKTLIEPFLTNNVIGMAVMAVAIGIAALKLPPRQKEALTIGFQALFHTFLKIVSWIITIIPIGIFAFMTRLVEESRTGHGGIEGLLLYALCVLGANVIQGTVVLPVLLKSKGISPLRIAKGMMPALTTAFFSKSSSATLPISLSSAKERVGISGRIADLSFPLCSVINMNGCAAFILITSLFVFGTQGVTFGAFGLTGMVIVASLAAIGNAGVPMGCYFLTTALLVGMGASIEVMGIILPIYSLFDMVETALNVWSDSVVTTIVDRDLVSSSENFPGKN